MPDKFSKYLDLALEITFYVLVLMAPLFFDRRIGIVFSLSKATWIRALTLIIIGLWLTKFLAGNGRKFIKTPLDMPVLTYILCVAASTLLSVNVYTSLVGSYGRYEGFMTILNYAVLFFITTNFITSGEKRRRTMMLAVIAGLLMGIYGVIQRLGMDPYAWGGVVTNERIIATIGQPNFLAAYLDMAFLLGIALLFTLNKNFVSFGLEEKPPHKQFSWQQKGGTGKKAQPAFGGVKYKIGWNEIFFQSKFAAYYALIPIIFIFSIYKLDGYTFFASWLVTFMFIIGLAVYYAFNFEKLDVRISSVVLVISLVCIFTGIMSTQSRGGWIGLLCGIAVFVFLAGRRVLIENKWKWLSVGIGCSMVLAISFLTVGASQFSRFGEVTVSERGAAAKVEAKGAAGSRIETWTSAVHEIVDRPFFGVGPEVIKAVFPQYETPKFRFKEAFHVKQDRCHNEILDMTVTRGYIGLIIYVFMLGFAFYLGVRQRRQNTSDPVLISALLGAFAAYLAQNEFSFGVVAITSIFWIIIGMAVSSDVEAGLKPASTSKIRLELIILLWVLVAALAYISAFPYLADKHFKSGKTFADSNMSEQSFAEFDSALKLTPYDGGLYTNYAMTILNSRAGKPLDAQIIKRAVSIFKKGQQIDPYNADNYYMGGRAYLILNDVENNPDYLLSSEALSRRAVKIDPYYAEAYQNLGFLYEKKGGIKDAIGMYEKAFIANPTFSDLGMSIYRYYKQTGGEKKAFKIFESSLEQNPDNTGLLNMLGDFYGEMGLKQKALEQYNRVLSISANDVKAMTGIGMISIQNNDTKEAFKKFQEAMLIDPTYPGLHNGLGAYYLKTGDRKTAKQEFEQTLSFDANNEYAKKMLEMLK